MRRLRNFSIIALAIVLAVALLASAYAYYAVRRPLPKQEGELVVQGMQDAITIYRDSWGVPHIYAANPYDLFFAQGFVHAQDRWWQMDISRRLGHGTLSALLGQDDAIQQTDRMARTLAWEQLALANYNASSFETRAALHAYAAGVNAYIEDRSPGELAVEYTLLDLRMADIAIEPWTPLDTLVWMLALQWQTSGNVAQEIENAQALTHVDEAMLAQYTPLTAADAPAIFAPDGSATATPTDTPDTAYGVSDLDFTRLPLSEALAGFDLIGPRTPPDGTAWVVSGKRTASGTPLLAAAPSAPLQMPSPWYEIGLYCIETPDRCQYNVTGLSVPGIPAVHMGHNGQIAWALNNAWIDEQDLFVVRLNPDAPTQYLWDGAWVDMTLREEQIAINGVAEPQTFTVYETHLGPVIAASSPLLERDQALVVRWTAQAAPSDPLSALFKLNRAASWEEFQTALSGWTGAAQTALYAGADGTIGAQLVGRVPVRSADHTGLLPVASTLRADGWRGIVPYEQLPGVVNPADEMIVAANNPVVPAAYAETLAAALADTFGADATYAFTTTAAPGIHAARIAERLRDRDAHTPDTFADIQADTFSPTAAAALPYLLDFATDDAKLQDMLAWLGEWDGAFTMDSPQAALFGAFWLRLIEYTYADELGAVPCDCPAVAQGMLALLESPNHAWWDDVQTRFVVERRDAILRRALEQAIADLTHALGAQRDAWRWGDLHTVTVSNATTNSIGVGLVEGQFVVGPLPASGASDTLNTTRSATSGRRRFSVVTAPAARLILDPATPETSRAILATGQSNHLASDHYRDMVDPWRFVEYHTMLWTRASVEEDAAAMLALEPVYIPLATPIPTPEE